MESVVYFSHVNTLKIVQKQKIVFKRRKIMDSDQVNRPLRVKITKRFESSFEQPYFNETSKVIVPTGENGSRLVIDYEGMIYFSYTPNKFEELDEFKVLVSMGPATEDCPDGKYPYLFDFEDFPQNKDEFIQQIHELLEFLKRGTVRYQSPELVKMDRCRSNIYQAMEVVDTEIHQEIHQLVQMTREIYTERMDPALKILKESVNCVSSRKRKYQTIESEVCNTVTNNMLRVGNADIVQQVMNKPIKQKDRPISTSSISSSSTASSSHLSTRDKMARKASQPLAQSSQRSSSGRTIIIPKKYTG